MMGTGKAGGVRRTAEQKVNPYHVPGNQGNLESVPA
jgi:hypothetical protein